MGGKLPFYQPSNDLRLTPVEVALLKCLSLFGVVMENFNGNFYHDQLIEGLYIVRQENVVYTWVVFAVQLFVDTRRVVGPELGRCFKEAQEL